MGKRDLVIGALLCLLVLLLVNQLLMIFSFRLDMAGLEDCMVYMGMELRSGKIYGDPARFPFQMLQYPPFYYWLTFLGAIPLEWITGDDVRAFYLSGRMVSFLGSYGALCLLFLFLRRELKWQAGEALVPVALAACFFTTHMFTVRPDGLKLLLEVAMAYLAFLHVRESHWKYGALWVILGAMALLSKQDAAIQMAVIAAYLLSSGRIRSAFLWPLAAIALAAVTIMLYTGFDAAAIYANILLGITQGVDLIWTKALLTANIPLFTVLAIWWLVVFVSILRKGLYTYALPFLLLLAGGASALLKWGANVNYLIDLQIALLLSLAIMYREYGSGWKGVLFLAGSLILFGNNILSRNILPFNFWSEREAKNIYGEHKDLSLSLAAAVDDAGYQDIILFNTKLTLFIHERTVLGTLFNEYPELLEDVDLTRLTLPEKIFEYTYDCVPERDRTVCLLAPFDDASRQLAYLPEIFVNFPSMKVVQQPFDFPGWNLYRISCRNE